MKASKRQKLVASMLDEGFCNVESASQKYLGFRHPHHVSPFWLGAAGAIRVGKNPSNSRSYSRAATFHRLAEKFWPTLSRIHQKHIIESYPQPARRERYDWS